MEKVEHVNVKKRNKIIIGITTVVVIIMGFYLFYDKEVPVEDRYICVTHENLAQHKHAQLEIISNGKKLVIPANIGVDTNCTAELHTHDDSGLIHIESYKKDKWFSIADFYNEWQREKNFDLLANESFRGTSKVYVNGIEHPRKGLYLFSDGDNVTVVYNNTGVVN